MSDKAMQVIEEENTELKTELLRVNAILSQCDQEHAETLENLERLQRYVYAVLDYVYASNQPESSVIKDFLRRGLGIFAPGYLLTGSEHAVMNDEDDVPF